ncbi:hypothetical protein Q8A73_008412 [Channa argus]|nr:hypothetical protein Q8A73_008412 [Channa argus]
MSPAGHLQCGLHTELLYWGIDLQQMEPCCHHHMMSSVEDVAEHQRKEDEWQEKRRALRAAVTQGGLLHMMGQAVENPHSGLAGKVFAFLSVIMVVLTVVSLCTMSDHQQEDATEKCSQKCRNMFVVESLGLTLRVMRALRILYVMRLARHSLGVQTLGLTIQQSTKDFSLLMLFICVAVALFSLLVHLARVKHTWPTGSPDHHLGRDPNPVFSFHIYFPPFYRTYTELKEENKRLWKEEREAELATEAEESMIERKTWPEIELSPGQVTDIVVLAQSKSCQPLLCSETA